MPLIKSKSRKAFVSNLKAEMEAGKPQNQALAIAYAVKRRAKRASGGAASNPALWDLPDEEVPHQDISARRGVENVATGLGHIAKSILWDLPHRAIDSAKGTTYGLRREDFTDVPPDYSPDQSKAIAPLNLPKGGWQPTDDMIGASLEAGMNVMGGTALSSPGKAAGKFVAGAGPRDPALWHGISKVKLPRPISEMSAVHQPASTFAERFVDPAALQGGRLLPLIGDRARAGTNLQQVNGFKFDQPVPMQGGHGFMAENADKGAAWASGKSVTNRLANTVRKEAGDAPVYGVYTAMGERSGDFSHHVSDTLAEMLKHSKVTKAGRREFDETMRLIAPDWPGVKSEKLRTYLIKAPGDVRANFAKLMDTAKYQNQGFPSVGVAAADDIAHPVIDRTQTGWTFKDVNYPHQHMERGDWRAVTRAAETGEGVQEVTLPIRSLNATQKTVNPDFANVANDGLPFVIKKNGQYYVQDGHHRITAAADKGSQTAKVRLVDLDETFVDPRQGKMFGSGATDKRAASLAAVDDILDAERRLAGTAAHEPSALSPELAAARDPQAVGPGGGGAFGAGSLPEAEATAARWAGDRKPLEGIPGPLKINGQHFVPGPIGKIHDVAEAYMRSRHPDRPYTPPTKYHPLDEEHSKAIAQAYEEMKHTPNDPATKASYDALINETADQYQAIKATGLKIEPIPAGMPDPYAANPRMAAIDVAENNHLWFYPTEQGFGTVNKISDNPMLRPTGEKIGDHELLANDMFRIVHDYFGHLKEGHGFRAAGEDNAWRTHSAMYSDLARPAMTTETRGQNSAVNYSNTPLYKAIGEAKARELYGNEGRTSGAESGSLQRSGVQDSQGVPGLQPMVQHDGPVLQSEDGRVGALRGARHHGPSDNADAPRISGRDGAAADRETSGRPLSEQSRQLRAGERSLGNAPSKSSQPAAQHSADAGGGDLGNVGMGREDRNLSPHAVGSPEQVRMDRGASADASKVEPRWKTITVGEHNRKASAADTIYADQKVGLLPEWVMRDRGSPAPMIFYHGTPHSFNRFDISKIGAGEGNQAYGHGLYFAGHEPVSEWYRHQLATRQDPLLKKYKIEDVGHVIGSHLSDHGGDPVKLAASYAKQRDELIASGERDKATTNMIKEYDRRIQYLNDPERATGHMYQVSADVDPQRLLDYDVPFVDQSQYVQGRVGPVMEESVANQIAAIKKTLAKNDFAEHPEPGMRRAFAGRPLLPGARANLEGRLMQLEQTGHSAFPGKEIYKRVGLPAKNESEMSVNASKRLLGMDVPGLRYKDAGSRAPGQQGSHNYVFFSDDMLRILRKYGIAGIPAAGVLGVDGEERRAAGGKVETALDIARKIKRKKGGRVHLGPITGPTGGRADKRPMRVPNGSYILTADHVSGMGEGNTESGMRQLSEMFPKSKPSRMREHPDAVEILAADGEFCVSPEDIIDRFGDLDLGHRSLDAWQTQERQNLIRTLEGLDPPAQD